jgi:hypothetical protein
MSPTCPPHFPVEVSQVSPAGQFAVVWQVVLFATQVPDWHLWSAGQSAFVEHPAATGSHSPEFGSQA